MAKREGRVRERGGPRSEGVAKRRLRSLKRETGGGHKAARAKRKRSA
jgi:hypothetical protein